MNWIRQKNQPDLSTLDKIRDLLKIHYKLVMVQFDELTALKKRGVSNDSEIKFVNFLHNHYVVLGLGKSEMYTSNY
jgi:hypothetical protein